MNNYIFKPSAFYHFVKVVFFIIFLFSIYIIIDTYKPNLLKFSFNIIDYKITFFNILYFIIFSYAIKELIIVMYQKLTMKYTITDKTIIVKKGLFNNNTSINVNGRLIIDSSQNLYQLILGLITIELEADGDSSSSEGIMLNVPSKVFDIINSVKSNEGRY